MISSPEEPGRVNRAGQLRSHNRQPVMHFCVSRRMVAPGKIGSMENNAPSGHRNRQKKRGSNSMPTEISANNTMEIVPASVGSDSFCSMENTIQGLLSVIRCPCPEKQKIRMPIKRMYFTRRNPFPTFCGSVGSLVPFFFKMCLRNAMRIREASQ